MTTHLAANNDADIRDNEHVQTSCVFGTLSREKDAHAIGIVHVGHTSANGCQQNLAAFARSVLTLIQHSATNKHSQFTSSPDLTLLLHFKTRYTAVISNTEYSPNVSQRRPVGTAPNAQVHLRGPDAAVVEVGGKAIWRPLDAREAARRFLSCSSVDDGQLDDGVLQVSRTGRGILSDVVLVERPGTVQWYAHLDEIVDYALRIHGNVSSFQLGGSIVASR